MGTSASTRPRVLTIAGSDSGGGAGIQADLKTAFALGCHGTTAITAVTAQNSLGVQGCWELPTDAVVSQIRSVLDDIGVQAIKTGMLSSAPLVREITDLLDGVDRTVPVVVDPVAVSKHGDPLLAAEAVRVVRDGLLRRATVVTPNAFEAAMLTGIAVHNESDQRDAAHALLDFGPAWVLLKGGHVNPSGDAVDLITNGVEEHFLRGPRFENRHTHGTGCTLATALACYLARGLAVPRAAAHAKAYVSGAIARGFALGQGIGPVDHGWQLRPDR